MLRGTLAFFLYHTNESWGALLLARTVKLLEHSRERESSCEWNEWDGEGGGRDSGKLGGVWRLNSFSLNGNGFKLFPDYKNDVYCKEIQTVLNK